MLIHEAVGLTLAVGVLFTGIACGAIMDLMGGVKNSAVKGSVAVAITEGAFGVMLAITGSSLDSPPMIGIGIGCLILSMLLLVFVGTLHALRI